MSGFAESFTVTHSQFEQALLCAATKVIEQEQEINRINYYPVSDKDTGSNLSATLGALISDYKQTSSVFECLDQVGELAFDNARGNSGVLLSIWLSGFVNHQVKGNEFSLRDVFSLFEAGNQALITHLSELIPGTIVSFTLEVVPKCIEALSKEINTDEAMYQIEHALDQALTQTMFDNPILKENKVVDAGALAMFFFMKTMLESFILGMSEQKNYIAQDSTSQSGWQDEHVYTEPPHNRYCTEARLEIEPQHIEQAEALIKQHGDCDLFLKRNNKLRFHIHCNEPQALFQELMTFSKVKAPKVEDMLRQYQASTEQQDIAIVTDSSADLCPSLIEKYKIHVIPLSIQADGHELLDGLSLSSEYLYQNLNQFETYPSTATPKRGHIKATLDFLQAHHKQVLVLPVSSAMSGTYELINSMAEMHDNIHVFDTLNVAASLGWLVHRAAELRDEGHQIEQIIDGLDSHKKNIGFFFALDNVKAMMRSGRISTVKGQAATLLNVKPVITIAEDGLGKIYDKAFSKKGVMEKLYKIIEKRHQEKPIKQFSVVHVGAEPSLVAEFSAKLEALIGFKPSFTKPVSPAVGLHGGVGAIGAAFEQGAV